MGSGKAPNAFSITRDGKYYDATFSVDGDVVSVVYWGRDGVTRQAAQAEDAERPELTACQLLSEIVEHQPCQFT